MMRRATRRRLAFLLSLSLLAARSLAADKIDLERRAPGAAVFSKYCVLCHGVRAEGDGVAAQNLNPRPANLRVSTLSDAQKEAIIRNGGSGVGRSPAMPPWREELNQRQIEDLIAYLASLTPARQ